MALLAGTAAAAVFQLPVETIGSKFGGIPQSLPMPQMPALAWENIRQLIAPATTIALLAAIESLPKTGDFAVLPSSVNKNP